MLARRMAWMALIAGSLFLPACQQAAGPNSPAELKPLAGPKPWTNAKFNNAPEVFRFAIVSDRNGGERKGVFDAAMDKLNLLQPEFVMSVGDFIAGYTEDKAKIDAEWAEQDQMLGRLTMRFFRVAGNHDLTNPALLAKWTERFGPTYYDFVYGNVLFLCLNTNDPPGKEGFSPEQVAFVRKSLAAHRDVRWTFVFMHHPVWTFREPVPGWAEIDGLLKDRPHTVFTGHYHEYTLYNRNGHDYFVLATTGAATSLGAPPLGRFDEIVWVTMTATGPQIANLTLDGIWDKSVRTAESGARLDKLRDEAGAFGTPLFVDGDTFSQASTTLKLVNPQDQPMRVQAKLQPGANVRAAPESVDMTVPAKTTRSVDVRLTAAGPLPVDDVAPITVKSTAGVQLPGQPPLDLDRSFNLAPVKLLDCPRAAKPVVVDGKLDEWADLPFVVGRQAKGASANKAWRGPEDSWFRFAVACDDQFVYVAVETTDDKIIGDEDMIQMRIEPAPDSPTALSRPGAAETQLPISASPGSGKGQIVHDAERLPPGTKVACVAWEHGLRAEFAVPVKYLDAKQGRPWQKVRLNVMIDDYDQPGGAPKLLRWKPTWTSPGNILGAGTFNGCSTRPSRSGCGLTDC